VSEVEAAPVLFDLDMPGRKRCSGCGTVKPIAGFSSKPYGRPGFRKLCKVCSSRAGMQRRDKDPDKELNRHLVRKFGITLEDFRALVAKQGGVCAICGEPPTIVLGRRVQGRLATPRLVVDHDHATGVVRGLLCVPCNRGIGLLKDDPKRLRSAFEYLEGDRE
jgi:hypothetical protein